MFGTTAQRVLRASRVPVLAHRRSETSRPRRILFTTNLSELSARVHERGLALVSALWGDRDLEMRSLFVAGDELPLPPPVHQDAMRERAETELAEFLQGVGPGPPTVEGVVRLGLAARQILAEAEAWGADLLVLGTHGRTGSSRFLMGSVAETTIQRATRDVLVFPLSALGRDDGADEQLA